MRPRFTTSVIVAAGALVVGALGVAATLAASDPDHWPGWLRPFHRYGWWSVLVLLLGAAVLAAWQFTRQTSVPPPLPGRGAHAEHSGPVAGRDVTITGGQGLTAGRDVHTVTGSGGPTAGRDLHLTTITLPAPISTSHTPAPLAPAGPITNLPLRNLAFTGRRDLLDGLHQQLTTPTTGAMAVTALLTHPREDPHTDAGAPRVLHGLGGVGKTQLVAEYAHRHAADYQIRWWVPAEQPAAIPGRLVDLARRLGIREEADQSETIAALLDQLGRRGSWLLLFDNAEDPHDLHPYWPSTEAGGRVLITSRNPHWQPLAAPVPVDVLPHPDAIAFLQRRGGIDKDDADTLADALGDLPLALEQAAAYLEQTHTLPGEYLGLLATRARELFALGRPATSEQTIATIWTVSLDRLREQAPAAEDLLSLCAFLAADAIPRDLPAQHPDLLPKRLQAAVRDPLAYQQAVAALRRYSLLSTSPDGQALGLHRLVQAVVRHQLDPRQERQWAGVALGVVRAAFPARPGDPDAWPAYARLLPHALAVASHAHALGVEADEATWLLREAGLYLWQRADHAQARSLHERALALDEARLGADHPDTARSLNNLAGVLYDQGDLDTARTLYERALAIREARLGADHPDTARSLSNLAGVLRAQGDLDRARTLHGRALAIREARLGADHPDTVRSRQQLAAVVAALDTRQ